MAVGVLLVGPSDLFVERLDVGGEEAVEVEEIAFAGCEGGAFVVVWRAEEIAALGFGLGFDSNGKSDGMVSKKGILEKHSTYGIRAFNRLVHRQRQI